MVTSRIDSKHHGRCDSPVAPREKATDPYVNLRGSLTLLFHLKRRADLHVSTQLEVSRGPRDPCQHWRITLRFQPQLHMRTLSLAATAEESREPSQNSHGDWAFLRPHERVPDVPVVTREEPKDVTCCHKSRKTRIFSPQSEIRPSSSVTSRGKSHLPSLASKESLTPWRQLKKFPTYPSPLERNTECLARTQDVCRCSLLISR